MRYTILILSTIFFFFAGLAFAGKSSPNSQTKPAAYCAEKGFSNEISFLKQKSEEARARYLDKSLSAKEISLAMIEANGIDMEINRIRSDYRSIVDAITYSKSLTTLEQKDKQLRAAFPLYMQLCDSE